MKELKGNPISCKLSKTLLITEVNIISMHNLNYSSDYYMMGISYRFKIGGK